MKFHSFSFDAEYIDKLDVLDGILQGLHGWVKHRNGTPHVDVEPEALTYDVEDIKSVEYNGKKIVLFEAVDMINTWLFDEYLPECNETVDRRIARYGGFRVSLAEACPEDLDPDLHKTLVAAFDAFEVDRS